MKAVRDLITKGYNFQIRDNEILYEYILNKEIPPEAAPLLEEMFSNPQGSANFINTLVAVTMDRYFHVKIKDCTGDIIGSGELHGGLDELCCLYVDSPQYDTIAIRHYKRRKEVVIINQDLDLLQKYRYKYVATEVQQIGIFD